MVFLEHNGLLDYLLHLRQQNINYERNINTNISSKHYFNLALTSAPLTIEVNY
jgi:hypothetical protein